MPSTEWTVTTKSNGTITADALTADWPTVTRGSQARLRLWFDNPDSEGSLIVEDGESVTVSSDTTVRRVRVEDNGTLTVADGTTLTVDTGGLYSLLQYLDYADAAASGAETIGRSTATLPASTTPTVPLPPPVRTSCGWIPAAGP